MRLHNLDLENFKGVEQRRIEFPDTGVAVIQGPNEAGKTSTIQALDLLLTTLPDSKKASVKSARPEGKDVPVSVQAEFTVDGHRVRYRKQWLKNPQAEVEFVSGPRTGDRATGRDAHAVVEDLLGRTDQTLWGTLRLLQSETRSNDFAGSAALRRALESSGGQVADDDESTSLVQAARAERDLYFTATGQEKGDTKRLRAEHAAAVTAHDGARAGLEAITALVEDFDRKDRLAHSAQLSHDKALTDLRAAEHAAAHVEDLGRRRQDARTAAAAALNDHQRATELVTDREALAARVTRSQESLTTLAEHFTAVQAKAASTASEARRADTALRAAREHQDASREELDLAQRAQRRTRDRARKEDLTALITQLDALADRAVALNSHATTKVTADLLEQLERAHRSAELARTQLQVASAQMTVTALESERGVVIDGEHRQLSPGQDTVQAVTEEVVLELPGQIRVQITPEQGLAQRRTAVVDAEEELQRTLALADVESLDQARRALAVQTELDREVKDVNRQRELLLHGRDESLLRSELSSLTTRPDLVAPEDDDDPTELDDRLARAEVTTGEAREAVTVAERRAEQARAQENKALQALNTARAEHASQTLLLKDHESQLEQARTTTSDEQLKTSLAAATDALERAESTAEALDQQWLQAEAQSVLDRVEAHRTQVENTRRSLERARTERTLVQGTLEATDRDARQREFDRAVTALRQSTRRLNTQVRRAAAAALLADTLETTQAQAHRRYNAPFRARLEQLGQSVFGSTFRVELSDDLVITRRYLNGTWLGIDALSTGAREQLDVLVRLAVAMLVDPVDGVPVILDDALGHTDPERLINLSSALKTAGEHAQVLVLTATPDRFASIPGATLIGV